MENLEQPDLSKHTLEQLRSVLSTIDREQHANLASQLEVEIEERLSHPKIYLDEAADSGFFNLHVPTDIVVAMYLRFLLWSFVIAIALAVPVVVIVVIVFLVFGVEESNSMTVAINLFLSIAAGFLALHKIMGTKYKDFEIVILRKEEI